MRIVARSFPFLSSRQANPRSFFFFSRRRIAAQQSNAQQVATPNSTLHNPVGAPEAQKASAGHSFRLLVTHYGLPLAVYLFVFDEMICLAITCALQYDLLGAGDTASLLAYVGGNLLDVNGLMGHSVDWGPIHISARLATNYAVASVLSGATFPLQLPFCVATLPVLRNVVRKVQLPPKLKTPMWSSIGCAGAMGLVGCLFVK